MAEITQLLSLWRDRERPSREVKAIAERHLAGLKVSAGGTIRRCRQLLQLMVGRETAALRQPVRMGGDGTAIGE